MTLICPRCKGGNIEHSGVLGTHEPRYECRDCGYVGALVLEDKQQESAEQPTEPEENNLICPNCGSDQIKNAIPQDVQGSFAPRYACKSCGYSGPSALKRDTGEKTRAFPYAEVLVFFFLSAAWLVMGAGWDFALLFFAVPSAAIILFRYLLAGEDNYSVEEDLKSLDENGMPKER